RLDGGPRHDEADRVEPEFAAQARPIGGIAEVEIGRVLLRAREVHAAEDRGAPVGGAEKAARDVPARSRLTAGGEKERESERAHARRISTNSKARDYGQG